MTIRRIEITSVRQPMADPEWRFGRGPISHVDGFAIALSNDDGATGYGYCRALPPWTPPLSAIRRLFDQATVDLIGCDERDIAATMARVDRRLTGAPGVRGGIECAVYDLQARALGVPLYLLFGGKRHDLFANTRIIPLKTPAEMAAVAALLTAEGYRHLKVKASGDSRLDLDRVRAVREAVGADIALMVDANETYAVKEAIATIGKMAELGVRLVEQPVPAGDPCAIAEVAANVPVPIEADEGAYDLRAVLRLACKRNVQSINIRVLNLGGLDRALTAAKICVTAGIGFRFGAIFAASVMHAHTIHLAASLPAPSFPHEFSECALLLDDPFVGLELMRGTVRVPGGIGCGVALRG